jgi:hypothetical protein
MQKQYVLWRTSEVHMDFGTLNQLLLFLSVLSIFFKVKVLIRLPLTSGWIMCGSHHFLASILSTISQIQVLDYFIIVCHSHIMVDYAQFRHIIKVVI